MFTQAMLRLADIVQVDNGVRDRNTEPQFCVPLSLSSVVVRALRVVKVRFDFKHLAQLVNLSLRHSAENVVVVCGQPSALYIANGSALIGDPSSEHPAAHHRYRCEEKGFEIDLRMDLLNSPCSCSKLRMSRFTAKMEMIVIEPVSNPLSPNYPASFSDADNSYLTLEHFCNYKLLVSLDAIMPEQVLACPSADASWNELRVLLKMLCPKTFADHFRERIRYIYEGLELRYAEDQEFARVLIATGDTLIIYAETSDAIWGIGMPENAFRSIVKEQNLTTASLRDTMAKGMSSAFGIGQNQFGLALMQLRDTKRNAGPGPVLQQWQSVVLSHMKPFEPIVESAAVRGTIERNLKRNNLTCKWKISGGPATITYAPTAADVVIDEKIIVKVIRESFISTVLKVPNGGGAISPKIAANFAKKCEVWYESDNKSVRIALSADNSEISIFTHSDNKSNFEFVLHYLEQLLADAKRTPAAIELSDTSPELARAGNAKPLALLLARQIASQTLKTNITENGMKLEFTGTEADLWCVSSRLADEANEFSCRPYVISHPLVAYMLLTKPGSEDLMSHIEQQCGCLIVPASEYVDLAHAENAISQSEVKLRSGRILKIVELKGDICRQNVDVILKPVFRLKEFEALRTAFAERRNAAASADTFLAKPGLLLCERVLYALFVDSAASSVSREKTVHGFFSNCLRALGGLGAKSLAIPTEGLCSTNIFNGDVKFLQSALADAVSDLSADAKLAKLGVIRLVAPSEQPPKAAAISPAAQTTVAPATDSIVLRLTNGVTLSVVQGNIEDSDCAIIVCSTRNGEDLMTGGASCKAIFSAGGTPFAQQVKSLHPHGLAGRDCLKTKATGSLKCRFVLHVALPACPPTARSAEQVIWDKAMICFEEVSDFESIAFPVIGAGGLKYPEKAVAQGLVAAASDWASGGDVGKLKDIRFVVHTSDQTSMQAFQDIFRSYSSQNGAPKSNVPHLRASRADDRIVFKLGSIEVKLDQVKLDVSREHLLLVPCDDTFSSDWIESLVKSLRRADSLCHVESVIVPLQIGGLEAMSPAYLADLFFAACEKFAATSPVYLRTLRPYVDNSSAADFFARMEGLAKLPEKDSAPSRGGLASVFSKKRPAPPSSSETLVRQLKEMEARLCKVGLNNVGVQLRADFNPAEFRDSVQPPCDYVIYGNTEGIARAVEMLNAIQLPFAKGTVKQPRFDRISKGFTETLTPASFLDFCIASKPGTTPAALFIQLSGEALADLTADCNPPSPLPKDVLWYLQTPDAAWHLFDSTEAAALEFLAKVPNQPIREARLASFDFRRRTVLFGNKVLRMMRKTDLIPAHWVTPEEKVGHQFIDLARNSKEFADIYDIVQQTNTQRRRILKIQRIENRPLFRQYLIQKEKVTRTCPDGHLIERDLFHGTSQAALNAICFRGFDRSLAGTSVGAIYGNGAYFSSDFEYSSDPMYAKNGHVLYCKVLVGESVLGKEGLQGRDLPPKAGYPGAKYDSAVNDLTNPYIFVVFSDCNAYPAYLISIK